VRKLPQLKYRLGTKSLWNYSDRTECGYYEHAHFVNYITKLGRRNGIGNVCAEVFNFQNFLGESVQNLF
jgi:hypothetical protein